jgi:hypothetical protein
VTPSHPTLKASLLMFGVVIALNVISMAGVVGRP